MAGRGSHYCVDFGPFPGPTAACLKGPVEAGSVPQGDSPRSVLSQGCSQADQLPPSLPLWLDSVRKERPSARSGSDLSH